MIRTPTRLPSVAPGVSRTFALLLFTAFCLPVPLRTLGATLRYDY